MFLKNCRYFSVLNDFKSVMTNAVTGVRGTLIETLGKRLSKSDAEALQKYISRIMISETSSAHEPKPDIDHRTQLAPQSVDTSGAESKKAINSQEEQVAEHKDKHMLHPIFGL